MMALHLEVMKETRVVKKKKPEYERKEVQNERQRRRGRRPMRRWW